MKHRLSFLTSLIFLSLLLSALTSCKKTYTPKPKGFIRIDYPKKEYTKYLSSEGFSFEYPVYARIVKDSSRMHPDWINIEFPQFDGKIYLSFLKINSDLGKYADESRDLAYKHSIKAESIQESLINLPEKKVYGIFYDIKGNAASSVQFFVTDSMTNFLRGSLYFNTQPNQDSLAPVIKFVREDIDHFIKTLEWNSGTK
ncbi:MAG: gliding motility lipoprotein GldD [Bacteroidales bacterium]|nr:gliding motility lipoprotein GldD [Bacteroidales bacterium]MCB9013060.1 gliding motility lipoprotein GldD [Bacteroidales bacterium]